MANTDRHEKSWYDERIDYLAEFMLPERFETLSRVANDRTRYMTVCAENTFHPQNASALVGRIIDTPGIRGFGLIDIKPEELYHYFPEIMRESSGCKFYNCTHTHEPQCAVMEAVVDGRISESRYESYLKMLDDDGKYR